MTDIAAVEYLLQQYFDALYHSDAPLLAQVMHKDAIYVCANQQPLLYRTMDEYLPIVADRPAPSARGENRRDGIDAIEFAGEDMAFARVRCSIDPHDYIDFLTVIRDEGRWQIISKVFEKKKQN